MTLDRRQVNLACSQLTCREVTRWLFSSSPEVCPHLCSGPRRDWKQTGSEWDSCWSGGCGGVGNLTSGSSGSTWSAELSACGCNLGRGCRFLWKGEKKCNGVLKKQNKKSKAFWRVCVISYAAARSTMVEISFVPSSNRVEMASLNHNLMSVTTWWCDGSKYICVYKISNGWCWVQPKPGHFCFCLCAASPQVRQSAPRRKRVKSATSCLKKDPESIF